MRVAWQLRRRQESALADAILLPSDSATDILAVHAQLGPGNAGSIYSTRNGLLVMLSGRLPIVFPGAVRLQALAENLLIPVDAELIPALHPEEARELVRDQGLVLLPHDRSLAFAPAAPLPLARFLAVPNVRRPRWEPFPTQRTRATQIDRILLERPEDPELDILGPGGEGIGEDAGRQQVSALLYRVVAWLSLVAIGLLIAGSVYLLVNMLSRLGTSAGPDIVEFLLLLGLGTFLFAKYLSRPAMKLIRKAAAAMPVLSEAVLREQDAALRALLRKFQAGKTEEALRRALPISSFAKRGSVVATNATLPTHDLLYSLRKLLGASTGPNSIWFGGRDSQALLAAEYRKVASQAAARGDHRRAAYIHAKLLGDMRSAANVLQQGGLFHDAAILYLKVLRDPRAAAAAFEAGGECDRALALYLEMGQLLQAAELLRRAGDEERALTYFEQAAQECISRNGDYLAAGDLMRSKAGRADLAQEYYEQGWVNRPAKNDMLCATALARAFAAQESAPDLRRLLTEAEQSLAAGGRDKEAADFFNEVARLASAPGLIRARDELRDQCLIALAGLLRERLRQETKPGKVVSNLLGASGTWDAAVVSDADFAWKAGLRERAVAPRPRQRSLTRLRFETGRVTAVCSAPGTGHLVLGFENGAIGCFDPVSGRWLSVEQPRSGSPVVSLATTMEGNVVVARSEPASDTKPLLRGNPRKHPVLTVSASQPASSSGALRSYALDSSAGYRLKAELPWEDPATLMAPLIVHYYGAPLCLIVKENQFWKFDANSLVWISQVELFHESGDCDDLMFLPVASHDLAFPVLILRTGATIWCCSAISRTGECRVGQLGWSPGFVEEEVLRGKPWNSILQSEHIVETAGLGTDGFIHHSELDLGGSQLRIRSSTALGQFNGCLAVCPIRAGLVAAIMPDRIVWFQTTFPSLHLQHTFETDCKGTLACFRSARTDELLIVFQDGEIARVAVPS